MRVDAVGFEPVISAVAGVQAVQPVQPVSPVDTDAVGHRDIYISIVKQHDTDEPMPSGIYNEDGLFVGDVEEIDYGDRKTEKGEKFCDVLARVIQAHSGDVEDMMVNTGLTPADLMDSDNLTDLIKVMNEMSDAFRTPRVRDIPKAVEEFYRIVSEK